jgi:retron-type reverse transcriptase
MSSVLDTYFNPKQLELAFHRVNHWNNRMVKDLVGIRAFGRNLKENCEVLSEELLNGMYKPRRGFKFYMPKPSKTLRTQTQLEVEDAIVYQAIANVLAQKSYHQLGDYSEFVFGSVLSPNALNGIELLNEEEPNYFFFVFWKDLYKKFSESVIRSVEIDKAKYKFETDITGFFDSIPHYNLLGILSNEFGVEDEVLDILSNCLNIWSGTKDSITPGVGIPQGPTPSYLLANILLHNLDKRIISEGFAYYRYMDDIKIFGNDEDHLLKALLIIDKYTKGNGLSINSKKTTIEEINKDKEDETVKAMKRVDTFSIYDFDFDDICLVDIDESDITRDTFKVDEPLNQNDSKDDNIDKEAALLSDQDGFSSTASTREVLTEEKDIIDFWQKQLQDAIHQIKDVIEEVEGELRIAEGKDDIDFIRASSKFGGAIKGLREMEVLESPVPELIPLFLFGVKKFFWRTNILSYSLMTYGKNPELKKGLIELYDFFREYEWVRFYIITSLSFTQKFSDVELRNDFYPILRAEHSVLVKIALYRLLFKHAVGKQLLSTIETSLKREDEYQIKLVITDFNRLHRDREFDVNAFIETIGL